MSKSKKISVVVTAEELNPYLEECLKHLVKLNYPDFEILVFPTKDFAYDHPKVRIFAQPDLAFKPAERRDLALKHAGGEILAFIDDDAYPSKGWLRNAVKHFGNERVAAVGGPGVTPPGDSIRARAGGWVSASGVGGGGTTYRFLPRPTREVDDYPSMNLLVRMSDFEKVGGFDSHYWPGEDTKLCLDLTRKLGKKILYDPRVLVFHHRRALFIPHLKQNGRYGLHRGYFAKVLPETSRRLDYFVPSLFTLFFFFTPMVMLLSNRFLPLLNSWLIPLYLILNTFYLLLLFLTAIWVHTKERHWKIALLVIPGIFLTHLWYGLQFIRGLLSSRLKR